MAISPGMIDEVLDSMYEHRDELVPCFLGKPGIGKTQGVYTFAKRKGIKVVTFILSNTVPSEISGCRMPDKDTKKMEVFDDAKMSSLEDGDILFFDEILEAPPILQAACLTLIQDRIMASGKKLPNVMIVAASNPVFNPRTISEAFRDRFCFIQVEFSGSVWTDWIKQRHGDIPDHLLQQLTYSIGSTASDGYNTLTARKATKLLDYILSDDKLSKTKMTVVTEQFGSNIASVLKKIHESIKHYYGEDQKALVNMLKGMEIELPDKLVDMSVDELLAWIETSPDQDKIMEAMKEVTLE